MLAKPKKYINGVIVAMLKKADGLMPVVKTCPHCLIEYDLDINGTMSGCDRCEGIVRLPNGMIDEEASSPEIFIRKAQS